MSHRIQRQRTKGWRMPKGAVYVGRPSRWGNHWGVGSPWYDVMADDWSWASPPIVLDQAGAVEAYRQDIGLLESAELDAYLAPLKGKTLVCWCPLDKPCHADVLAELVGDDPG